MENATDRPWNWYRRRRPADVPDDIIIFNSFSPDTPGRLLGTCIAQLSHLHPAEAKANAELITRAVNAHDELVAALELVQEALARWRDGEDVHLPHPIHGALNLEEVKYLIVDAALAKARGEEVDSD